jgi:hypothetical protein
MFGNFSIGVVTYLARYELYFRPLINKLHLLFPDYDINVWINGHHDRKRQVDYLRKVTSFLNKYQNVRYLVNYEHQPLASGFNRLILMAQNNRVLILNDDVKLLLNFRHNIENLPSPAEIFTLNGAWSHFVISKNVVKKVGWFDERLLGIGYEDTDYAIRLALNGIPLGNIRVHGLHDCMAPPEDATWADISELTLDKYSRINWEFFQKKWGVINPGEDPQGDALRIQAVGVEWRLRPDASLQETPEYYPRSCLDYSSDYEAKMGKKLRGQMARAGSLIASLCWQARLWGGEQLQKFLGPRWEQWRKTWGR